MTLYTIGEVAQLCDVNPVTLRAWQRRYGLLKPQRTDGGHRLFNEQEIDRIREIKRWIDSGVQVGKVKTLLADSDPQEQGGWREQQEIVLTLLHDGSYHRLRTWIKERSHSYPAHTLVNHLFVPLRHRLLSPQPTLIALRGILDGILINHIAQSLASAWKHPASHALVVGWNSGDIARLWLEGWVASEQGWRVDVVAHSLTQIRPELFPESTLLVWCGETPASADQEQLLEWQQQGRVIWLNSN
ncbi:MerR family transcriptional regulator [Raoultella ornithinolytica]|uniref:MerR family transcriptional regulator n=1 Tax=Raoultella ornithinolytica TaxID=54291 RepID=UPI0005983B1F|nr:MerR family transcriptional regulator [Raoultella ornithinolytica]